MNEDKLREEYKQYHKGGTDVLNWIAAGLIIVGILIAIFFL